MPKKSDSGFDSFAAAPDFAARRRARADKPEFGFGKKTKPEKRAEHAFSTATTAEKLFDARERQDNQTDFANAEQETLRNQTTIQIASPPLELVAAAETVKDKRKIETWLARRGHGLTFALLFLFTIVLYFRPYELFPALAGFSSIAWFLAIGTISVFVPSQLAAENNLTARPAEVNYMLLLALFGLITIPIARDPATAWQQFNDPFLKVVLIFVVMVNVVRTKKRLLAMIWLALGVGAMLAVNVLQNYASGITTVEDYRAMADIKGMFGNPNAQALHFVMIAPIAVALGLAARNFLFKILYFALAALFVAGNMVTFSRGGFLGLALSGFLLAWKFGRGRRLQVITLCAVAVVLVIALAPGGYGTRILSIVDSTKDAVGSSNQRSELLKTSLLVTARNPWGIGMGNFPLTNPFGLVTHNSYTQVSTEMGVLALVCYLMFHFEFIRRLFWMERELDEQNEKNEAESWLYYLNIGLQASFVGWCVGSFFDAAAYQWFLYYLAAYGICLRRVHQAVQSSKFNVQSQTA